jgi:hypothetical protein
MSVHIKTALRLNNVELGVLFAMVRRAFRRAGVVVAVVPMARPRLPCAVVHPLPRPTTPLFTVACIQSEHEVVVCEGRDGAGGARRVCRVIDAPTSHFTHFTLKKPWARPPSPGFKISRHLTAPHPRGHPAAYAPPRPWVWRGPTD